MQRIEDDDVARLRAEFARVEHIAGIVERFLERGRMPEAAACASIAAASAWRNHAGLFASPRLERALIELGHRTVPHTGGTRTRDGSGPHRVLHVLSKARPMGGDSRMVCRWIELDATRQHSVAVTMQRGAEIPGEFAAAAARSGGRVHCLDSDTRDPMTAARRLRALVADVDMVALHLWPDDIVPMLALADRTGLPPVAFIHHSDHTFWLGIGIADVVAHVRESARSLSVRRRHIEPHRGQLLPLPLPIARQAESRDDVRAALDIERDSIVLLSVGTAFKYMPVTGPGFLNLVLPVMLKHEDAVLLVVGPEDAGEWKAARLKTGGRIRPLGRRFDTESLFQSADIYLDSIPCTSPTAALEAGSFGLPIVTHSTHAGDARVFAPGAPGLDDSVCVLDDPETYASTVSRMISEPDERRLWGERAHRAVARDHQGTEWLAHVERLYAAAAAAPAPVVPADRDRFEADTIDLLINRFYNINDAAMGRIIDDAVGGLPLRNRVTILTSLLRLNRSFSFELFLPARLVAHG